MPNISTVKPSAQARLLLYRLFSSQLNDAEQQLFVVHPAMWENVLSRLEQLIDTKAKSDELVLKRAFGYMEYTTNTGLQKQFEKILGASLWLGVFPQGLLDSFIDEHQKLIKSVRREHLDRIGLAIKRCIREGRLEKDIAREIRSLTDLSKRRSRLIARNAPLQYSGALTRHYQKSAGIKRYRWQTSQDERVRESHRKLDGKIFIWEGAGPHPRTEVNCRCDAVPILD